MVLLVAGVGESTGQSLTDGRDRTIELLRRWHNKEDLTDTIFVIAHRGDWRNAPENSLQGILNCIDLGVDMVENRCSPLVGRRICCNPR